MSAVAVVLLTDFGASDWYVAAMKGVILAHEPATELVDLSHAVPPGDIDHAAFLLEQTWRWYPEGTVFLVVVDPGVGTARRALGVRAAERLFVGPDNGVLSPALEEPGAEAREIDPARVGAGVIAPTFHGRDLFAPAAAALAGLDVGAAESTLDQLAAVHLIQEHAPGRFRLHNLVRQYAAERAGRLDAAERARALRRLLGWYLRHACTAAALARSDGGEALLGGASRGAGWLEVEWANLVAAVRDSPDWLARLLADTLRGHTRRHDDQSHDCLERCE